jgi:hypothetical protein
LKSRRQLISSQNKSFPRANKFTTNDAQDKTKLDRKQPLYTEASTNPLFKDIATKLLPTDNARITKSKNRKPAWTKQLLNRKLQPRKGGGNSNTPKNVWLNNFA